MNKKSCLLVCKRGETIQYHSRLQTRKLGHHNHLTSIPPQWLYCQQAQCGCWFTVKHSREGPQTSSHPQNSASHLICLNYRARNRIQLVVRGAQNSLYYAKMPKPVQSGFHLHLLVFPFVYQFNSRIKGSSPSIICKWLVQKDFNNISVLFQNMFVVVFTWKRM